MGMVLACRNMGKVSHHPELEVLQAPKIDKEKDVEF